MRLAQLFSRHTAHSVNAAATSPESMGAALAQLFEAGRKSWPQIQIAPEEFVLFLAKQLPPERTSLAELSTLRAGELYLVCALGQGHPDALLTFESEYMPEVRRVLLRLEAPEPLIADIIQGLYGHLLERQNAPQGVSVQRGYAGRGELKGWLCTCAVHQAGRLHKRERREVALEQAPAVLLPEQSRSPELALLKGELKELFETAFREAVSALTSRERNLLRYHFLSGLSIDQIGTIYHIHRATAARWVAQARERLATETRKRFQAAAPTHAKSFVEIMELVRSQLNLNLADMLKHVTTDLPLPREALREE